MKRSILRHLFQLLIPVFTLAAAVSCSYGDDIEWLKVQVASLKESVEKLQQAYADGKIIVSVTPTHEDEVDGYLITFSDNTTITLKNGQDGADGEDGQDGQDGQDGADGKDGITPFVQTDTENYWCISYDNGQTYVRLTDANGNPVRATGAAGADGQNGQDGHCVRVVIDAAGHYVFEIYAPDQPATVIDRIETPYTAAAGSVLQSVVQDADSETIILTLADGSEFRFNLDVSYPTGLVPLTESIMMGPGGTGEIEFRVNPSHAYVNFIVDGDGANLQLDLITATSIRSEESSYVTSPQNYRLEKVEQVYNASGKPKRGQYRAIIRDLGLSTDYRDRVALVLTTKDGRGEHTQITSSLISVAYGSGTDILSLTAAGNTALETQPGYLEVKVPYDADLHAVKTEITTTGLTISAGGNDVPLSGGTLDLSTPCQLTVSSASGQTRTYTVAAHFSDLPVVYMDTPSPVTSKTEWTTGCTLQVWNAGDHNILLPQTSLKGRGNSTWAAPKKPYAIKLNSRTALFGLPAHKRWVLLANYYDPSQLRTRLGFYLSRVSSLAYTPRDLFVELVVNGTYQGLYQLTEKLSVDANRVNIGSTGMLFELDYRASEADGDVYFRADHIAAPVVIKEPDNVLPGSAAYEAASTYFHTAEQALFGDDFRDPATGYRAYLDAESFADWYLVNEISKNNDACFFSSCYMTWIPGGKLHMGPVWDFDLAFGNKTDNNNEQPEGLWVKDQTPWFRRLFEDPWFVQLVGQRFAYFDANRELIYRQMATCSNLLQTPVVGNNLRWPALEGDDEAAVLFSYNYKVATMRNWIERRMDWLRTEYANMQQTRRRRR